MKKFICNKFTKSPKSDESDKNSKRSSGFYDFHEAQLHFDQTNSLPTSVYVDSDSEEEEELYLDAKSSNELRRSDGENEDVAQTNIDKNNSQYEYDVPRISFKFFHKARQEENVYANEVSIQSEPVLKQHKKSEVRIVLQPPSPTIDVCNDTTPLTTDTCDDTTPPTTDSCHETIDSEYDTPPSHTSQSVPAPLTIIKSGSDPNLRHFDDDDFYQVPRSLTAQKRLSQSLTDFDAEIQLQTSNHSSIEHISCSQVQVNRNSSPDSLDYCKTRSRLPLLIRRATLLKKPRKAMDSWNNFKNKMTVIISEQAAQQRVGAFSDKSITFEDMYKNSKNKCKKIATRIFAKKKIDSSEASLSNSVATTPKLTSGDIEYKMSFADECECSPVSKVSESSDKSEFDFTTIRSTFKKKLQYYEGQNGFEDLRRYVKQGGDFCKELASILQERADAETQYAKSLSKLSAKLSRACRDNVGGVNDAWKAVAVELEAKAEAHRIAGASLLEETAKPLRNLTESQHRTRKQCENQVEKSARLLGDWRAAEAKGKKLSHTCARDNEKLQDAAVVDVSKFGKQTLSKSTSLIHLAHRQNSVDKENAKLEGKKKKAEDAVKKADIEYYTLCVRAERARLEWESAVLRGVNTFQTLEEERLGNLKILLMAYLRHNTETQPKIIQATERLTAPIEQAEPTKDLIAFQNLRQTSQQVSEQLLPDFYCEHITLAMNRERRKQALVKLLHLIRQDIERERKSKNGLENLSKAIRNTPNFGTEDSQQNVVEKLYHMKSMLTYLEGARYKVQSALAELDSRPRAGHPLAKHITVTRDKSGLQQSVLKVPQWLREELLESDKSPVSEKSTKSDKSDNSDPHINDVDDVVLHDWTHRGTADGNSNQPDSDFDEFSSQCSSNDHVAETENVHPIAKCKAIYMYTPNLPDELSLTPGDIVKVYRQQDDGWWLGETNGNVGIFPATYVEIVP